MTASVDDELSQFILGSVTIKCWLKNAVHIMVATVNNTRDKRPLQSTSFYRARQKK